MDNMLDIMRKDSLVLLSRLARTNLDDKGTEEMESIFKDFIDEARVIIRMSAE